MIFRFSLYGFLKNLRLFEAFLVLALLERGLDFLAIGGLVAIREITVNLAEIPSGALADALGRRRSMVASMAAYVASYLLLGLTGNYALLAVAMGLFGLGDALRSGTHKALIYTWLRAQGRESDRTQVYGYTRSWSKIGSGVSALLAGALVFASGSYTSIFLFSAIPAALNLVNLATYPAWLDGEPPGLRRSWSHLVAGLSDVIRVPALRRLVVDSLAIEGGYAAVKDYVQPVVAAMALTLPLMGASTALQRTAVLGGVVYAALFFLASFASRRAHRFEAWAGGTEAATRRLIRSMALGFIGLLGAILLGWSGLAIVVFVALGFIQNLWRPIHVGRFDRDGVEAYAATTLSIESQAKAGAAAIWAPVIGWLIDHQLRGAATVADLWPVTLVGLPVLILALRRRRG